MATNTATTYDEDSNDQPIDYSKKYTERNVLTQHELSDDGQNERTSKKEFRDHEPKVDLFSDYAETDLDQPTDYSLRYAEDDTDDDEKQGAEYFSGIIQEDTIKTYCTEGTPYETPFNFSTATSMSDLRLEEVKESEVLKKVPKKNPIDITHKNVESFGQTLPTMCDKPENSIAKELEEKKNDLVLNPGQVTPEKPINYYEEGTPGGFSRANSLSSLNSAVVHQNNESQIITKIDITDSPIKPETETVKCNVPRLSGNTLSIATASHVIPEEKPDVQIIDKEGKVVTFGGEDYYAEETPLMFSRCSSLGSLSGFEQHSIHDDRSSIVSDFSRRTSGIVSPSELPDSPTQTIPPSPRTQKVHNTDCINKILEESRSNNRQLVFPKSQIVKGSVFEDDIATFKEESTPIEFSTATSLSSLTIDDDIKLPVNLKSKNKAEVDLPTATEGIKTVAHSVNISNNEVENKSEQVSDGDEDDEDMLAACISMGMQNNRYRQSFKTANVQKLIHPEPSNERTRYQTSSVVNRQEHRVAASSVETSVANVTKIRKPPMDIVVVPDTVHVYCTEDTPADISPVGSQSNLSALSMPSVPEDIENIEDSKLADVECHRNDLSDESSNLSGDDEKILDECIKSGIPKVRQITPPPTNCISFANKHQPMSQKFNLCGTPLSSPVDCSHSNKSSMLCKPSCRRSLVHESELSDDSPNHSEDEAILTECIQSAMSKPRLNAQAPQRSLSAKPADSLVPKVNLRNSTPQSPYQNSFGDETRGRSKKDDIYDDSLSEEEGDMILAQCIRSGMPKALQGASTTSLSIPKRIAPCIKSANGPTNPSTSHGNKNYSSKGSAARNQASNRVVRNNVSQGYAINSPQGYSRVSSKTAASHVEDPAVRSCNNAFENMNISEPSVSNGMRLQNESKVAHDTIPLNTREYMPISRYSTVTQDEDDEDDDTCPIAEKSVIAPSRHSSVSSLSDEGSLGSIEEWALLELCITSGMPGNKCGIRTIKSNENSITNHEDCQTLPEDNYSVCSYNSYVCKT